MTRDADVAWHGMAQKYEPYSKVLQQLPHQCTTTDKTCHKKNVLVARGEDYHLNKFTAGLSAPEAQHEKNMTFNSSMPRMRSKDVKKERFELEEADNGRWDFHFFIIPVAPLCEELV